VRVIRDGSEPRIPITDVLIHDRAVVYAGETVPVDGVVISGGASIDNRTWTGEPTPVAVERGDRVLAGSTVSDGRIVIDVLAKGDNTRAGRLAAALEDAIAASTQVSDVARRIADRFVSPVFLLGGAVFLITGDLQRLISILIVDFGTGIRIAVPTAVLTTMIAGARSNILFRNGRAIEELAAIDTVVFDKTGTLTTGNPTVAEISSVAPWKDLAVLRLAAAAEGHLPHPIARALRRHARKLHLELPEPTRVSYQHGGGVVADIEGLTVMLGNRQMLDGAGIALPEFGPTDESVVLVAIDNTFAARIQIRDRLRSDAEETVNGLRAVGISHIWLATGDRRGPARAIAEQLNVDGFTARMQPEDKVELVRELRAQGRRVAVVGDGINDAQAMAEANVGVAVPRGADLARETADVVLGGEDLAVLIEARRLAMDAMSLVRQNIVLVAAPNAVALGIATAGGLSPLVATGVNNGSTLIAALNALRPLRRARRLPRPIAD